MTATPTRPWRGVLVATALPLDDDLSVNHARYAEHCSWLVENGCDGVVPNGSLGEYQVLTPEERAKVVETAVAAIGGERVMPGVAAYGSAEARRWAEQARDSRLRVRDAAAAQRVPRRRAVGAGALRGGRQGGGADRGVQQPHRHQGRPCAGTPRQAARRGPHPGRQGVLRRRPPRLSARRTRPGTGPVDRRRRRSAGTRARRRQGLGGRLPQRAARRDRRAVPGGRGRRPRHRQEALRATAPAAALGLQGRVRAGDQAVHGHRRPATAARFARRASRCCRSRRPPYAPPPRKP